MITEFGFHWLCGHLPWSQQVSRVFEVFVGAALLHFAEIATLWGRRTFRKTHGKFRKTFALIQKSQHILRFVLVLH